MSWFRTPSSPPQSRRSEAPQSARVHRPTRAPRVASHIHRTAEETESGVGHIAQLEAPAARSWVDHDRAARGHRRVIPPRLRVEFRDFFPNFDRRGQLPRGRPQAADGGRGRSRRRPLLLLRVRRRARLVQRLQGAGQRGEPATPVRCGRLRHRLRPPGRRALPAVPRVGVGTRHHGPAAPVGGATPRPPGRVLRIRGDEPGESRPQRTVPRALGAPLRARPRRGVPQHRRARTPAGRGLARRRRSTTSATSASPWPPRTERTRATRPRRSSTCSSPARSRSTGATRSSTETSILPHSSTSPTTPRCHVRSRPSSTSRQIRLRSRCLRAEPPMTADAWDASGNPDRVVEFLERVLSWRANCTGGGRVAASRRPVGSPALGKRRDRSAAWPRVVVTRNRPSSARVRLAFDRVVVDVDGHTAVGLVCPPVYWWTRWWFAHIESGTLHGPPRPKTVGEDLYRRRALTATRVRLHVVVDRGEPREPERVGGVRRGRLLSDGLSSNRCCAPPCVDAALDPIVQAGGCGFGSHRLHHAPCGERATSRRRISRPRISRRRLGVRRRGSRSTRRPRHPRSRRRACSG